MTVQEGLQAMKLQDLKNKKPADLLSFAEELEIENASSMRKQDMLFAILKELAERDVEIMGQGVVETLQDGFGFLRSPESNYLPGPDDIYVSPSQIRRFGLRTGDTVEGPIRAPKDGERYFALLKVGEINYDSPESSRGKDLTICSAPPWLATGPAGVWGAMDSLWSGTASCGLNAFADTRVACRRAAPMRAEAVMQAKLGWQPSASIDLSLWNLHAIQRVKIIECQKTTTNPNGARSRTYLLTGFSRKCGLSGWRSSPS